MAEKNIYLADLMEILKIDQIFLDPIENERWKEIKNTDGKYYISNYGRVISLIGKPKLLKAYTRNNYEAVKIHNKNYPIHRLVAEHFIDDKIVNNKEYLVHHKDQNKTNNKQSNLDIITHKQHSQIHNKEEHKNDT